MSSPKEFLFIPQHSRKEPLKTGLSFPTLTRFLYPVLTCPLSPFNSGNRLITVLWDTNLLETAVVYIFISQTHFKTHYLYVYECFACMYACIQHVYLVLVEVREGIGSSGTGVKNQLFMSWEDERGL